jgi:hypothetical protein
LSLGTGSGVRKPCSMSSFDCRVNGSNSRSSASTPGEPRGHKTPSGLRRYDIVASEDLRDARENLTLLR